MDFSLERIKKNFLVKSFLLVGLVESLNILVTFFLIFKYFIFFKKSEYGIWIAVFSTISWINIFDIGIGNGLRNKLIEYLSKNETLKIKNQIGATFAFFFVMLFSLFILFILTTLFFDTRVLFDAKHYEYLYFFLFINLITLSLILEFIFKIIDSISFALQKSYIPKLRILIKNILILITVSIMTFLKVGNNKLIYLALSYLIISTIINLTFTIFIFNKNKTLIPNFKNLNFSGFNEIGRLGIKFFVVQISAIVILSTDNFIVINMLGSEYVPQYDIFFKLFSIVIILQSFLTLPLWSAYTSSYEKNDYEWIKKSFKKSIYYSLILVGVSILIYLTSETLLFYWLNDKSIYNNSLALSFLIFTIFRLWSSNFSTLYNGIGELKLQIICTSLGAILNIPLSIFFVKYFNLESSGVVLASAISLSIFGLIAPFKLKSYLTK